jgi:hypothetical protein
MYQHPVAASSHSEKSASLAFYQNIGSDLLTATAL